MVLRQTKRVPAGYPAREISFNYSKEALHLYMDIYLHGFPARFISFIDMQIQVQALQNTNMDEMITLFELRFGNCLQFKRKVGAP